jgi:hypothetical protein
MERMMPISPFRLIYFGIIIGFTAQMVLIPKVGEPYPALTMPPFRGTGGYRDGKVEIERYDAVFVTPDKEFTISTDRLLDQFPNSHHGSISGIGFTPIKDKNELRPQADNLLSNVRKFLFPGYLLGWKNRTSSESLASLRDWLRNRAKILVPREDVIRVEIRWYRHICSFEEGEMIVSREPSGTVTISLEGEAR